MPQARAFIGNDEVGHSFKFNPNTVRWGYQENQQTFDTLGGRVIQVLSVKVNTMNVEGDAGSRLELQRMASTFHEIMKYHINSQLPVFFRVPSRQWSFKGYITSLPAIGWDVETVSYPYRFSFEVEEDMGVVTKRILTTEINRIQQDFPMPDEYEGDLNKLQEIVSDWLAKYQRGIGFAGGTGLAGMDAGFGGGEGGGPIPAAVSEIPTTGTLTYNQVATLVLFSSCFRNRWWNPEAMERAAVAVAISHGESVGFQVRIVGDSGNSRGLWQIYQPAHQDITPECAFNPICSTEMMCRISGGGFNWDPWSVWKNDVHLQYLNAARAAVQSVLAYHRGQSIDQEHGAGGPQQ